MGSTGGALKLLTHGALSRQVLRVASDCGGVMHEVEVVLSGEVLHGGKGNTRGFALHVQQGM